ncbi:MAG: protein kinase [Armatimonadota bacterium]
MVQQIGRYQIVRELGKGAMGIVYEAHDPHLGRTVALKILNFAAFMNGAAKREALERFTREGKIAAGLMHPNIAQVYDVGEDKGTPFLVMELCQGTSLRDMIQFEHAIPENRVRAIAEQLLSALTAAHARSIIHRDIKPDNIVFSRNEQIKLMDFGIAKIASDNTMTRTGQVLGSPAYMSPEQVLGKPVDQRSDLFSLGVVLYECLTGRKPFEGDSITAVSHKIAFEMPAPLTGQSPFWTQFLLKALEKDPAARFQTASQMVASLQSNVVSRPTQVGGTQFGVGPQSVPINQTSMIPPVYAQPAPGLPPPVQHQSFPPYGPPMPGFGYVKPHRGGMVLTCGIFGILCCGILALPAWIMGSADISEMDRGLMDPAGRSLSQSGMVCGIVGCVLWGLWLFGVMASGQ